MQKSFVAIALALTLSCAVATYTTENYAKGPIVVAQNNETFANTTSIDLVSITVGDLYLFSANISLNATNPTTIHDWTTYYKKLDAKSLTSGANVNANFTVPIAISAVYYYNSFAFGITMENDEASIPQLKVYQTPINGGAPLPKVTLTANTNKDFTPTYSKHAMIGKIVYVFYVCSAQKLNVTNFQVGASNVGTGEFNVTEAYDDGSLSVVSGESLSSNQLLAIWTEAGVLKESIIDVSKRSVTSIPVGNYVKGSKCVAYATDKKYHGEICMLEDQTAKTYNYSIRTSTDSLVSMANYSMSNSTMTATYAYGPYLAIIFEDSTATPSVSYRYEIWNLDTLTLFKNSTHFLTIDSDKSGLTWFRVPQGGLYTLLWEKRTLAGQNITNIQVGLLLGSSYLASVFGFLLTIIAGLLLF